MVEVPAKSTFTQVHATCTNSSSEKRVALYEKFKAKVSVNRALKRELVSFQANKSVPFYAWFKYKEGFSESLVIYLLEYFKPRPRTLLDPFSGAGSALFAANALGWHTQGIEVLPVGIYATHARFVAQKINPQVFRRSGRSQGKKVFNKGYIPPFCKAIDEKLQQMALDLEARPIQQNLFSDSFLPTIANSECELNEGSCLEILPTMEMNTIDFVLTSPPYANRYDYTRTYALELIYLGCDEEKVKQLRQTMLSCTVENKDKRAKLEELYTSLEKKREFQTIDTTFQKQEALQEVLALLETYRDQGKLNNQNIAKMVRNYFYEMSFVIYELARILKPGGIIVMVNDNVRYAGEEVPVDLILSEIAESFGLTTRHIWALDRGKGNSSQQMGNHGRTELRKCVYVWEKLN